MHEYWRNKLLLCSFLKQETPFAPIVIVIFQAMTFMLTGGCSANRLQNTIAPNIDLSDTSGQQVKLTDYRGHTVLLAFSAVRCGPCRIEAAELESIQKRFEKKGVRVLMVNAWDEPLDLVCRFKRANALTFPILVNGGAIFRDLYYGTAVPHLFVVDCDGTIVFSKVGWAENYSESLEQAINQSIHKTRPSG